MQICLFCVLVSDKKSERAKDMHLLRRLTTLLRSREVEPGQIYLINIHEMPCICFVVIHIFLKKEPLPNVIFSFYYTCLSLLLTFDWQLCLRVKHKVCYWTLNIQLLRNRLVKQTYTNIYMLTNCLIKSLIDWQALESLLSNKTAPVSCLTNVTRALLASLKEQGNTLSPHWA